MTDKQMYVWIDAEAAEILRQQAYKQRKSRKAIASLAIKDKFKEDK